MYKVEATRNNETMFITNSVSTIYGLTTKINDILEYLHCEILLTYKDTKAIGFFQETPNGYVAVDFEENEIGDIE